MTDHRFLQTDLALPAQPSTSLSAFSDGLKSRASIAWRPAYAVGLCLIAFTCGCKEKPEGPKRADNEAAHQAHYSPEIHRSSVTGQTTHPSDEATASRPAATRFADLIETGVIGSPVLFVNNQPVTVAEILEPLIESFRRQSKVLSENDYADTVLREIRNQVDYQISTLLVYDEAKS